jgi:hypothetical protein
VINSANVRISWVPPTDTPNCVTGYYIEHNGVRSPIITGTSDTVDLTTNTRNIYTVIATNAFGNENSSSDIIIDAYEPLFDLSYSFRDGDINDPTDTILVLSWKYATNDYIPPVINQLLNFNGMPITGVTNSDRSKELTDDINEGQNYTVNLTATNAIGSRSNITVILIPSPMQVVKTVQPSAIKETVSIVDTVRVTTIPDAYIGAVIGLPIITGFALAFTIVAIILCVYYYYKMKTISSNNNKTKNEHKIGLTEVQPKGSSL